MRFLPACCRGISYGPYLSELSPMKTFRIRLVASSRPPIPTSIKTTSHCSSLKYKMPPPFPFQRCRVRSHFVRNFTDTAYIISISVLNHIFCIYTKLFKIIKTDGGNISSDFLAGLNQNLFGKSTYTSFTVSAGDVNNIKFILRITEFIAEI